MTKEEFVERSAKIDQMTTEQKGFYLLDAVRQIAFGSGTPEGELIAMLVDNGGMLSGLVDGSMQGSPN